MEPVFTYVNDGTSPKFSSREVDELTQLANTVTDPILQHCLFNTGNMAVKHGLVWNNRNIHPSLWPLIVADKDYHLVNLFVTQNPDLPVEYLQKLILHDSLRVGLAAYRHDLNGAEDFVTKVLKTQGDTTFWRALTKVKVPVGQQHFYCYEPDVAAHFAANPFLSSESCAVLVTHEYTTVRDSLLSNFDVTLSDSFPVPFFWEMMERKTIKAEALKVFPQTSKYVFEDLVKFSQNWQGSFKTMFRAAELVGL